MEGSGHPCNTRAAVAFSDKDFNSKLVAGGGKWLKKCCASALRTTDSVSRLIPRANNTSSYCPSFWQQVNGLVLGLDHSVIFYLFL